MNEDMNTNKNEDMGDEEFTIHSRIANYIKSTLYLIGDKTYTTCDAAFHTFHVENSNTEMLPVFYESVYAHKCDDTGITVVASLVTYADKKAKYIFAVMETK